MSGFELFVDDIDGRLHAAVIRKTTLSDLYVDPAEKSATWGSMYVGKVVKLDKNLDAAIVDLGNGLQGLLPSKHVFFPGADHSMDRSGITELLDPGQVVMVQIKSEAKRASQFEQNKLPRLTMKLYVIGQYLLYSPISNQVTISRRIGNDKILGITSKLEGKGGWIVQQNADYATESDIHTESRALLQEWQRLSAVFDGGDNTPRLVQAGPNALYRALNDYGANHFDHIHVGNKKIFDMMAGWCAAYSPKLAESKKLRLFKPEQPQQKLFDIHDIYSELEALTESLVVLNSGGSIIIENTSAATMVDVNQGSGGQMEANIDAAQEIARQARLRNLSGAILVDFINMAQKTDRSHLVENLEKIFASDAGNTQVHGFTRLGYIELTRKRRSATLAEKLAK